MLTQAGFEVAYIESMNGCPTECTIKGRCHTHIFEFPKAFLQAETDVGPLLIAERKQFRATMVSDLLSYFQRCTPFRHHLISHPFRRKVEEVAQKRTSKSQKNGSSLFVVIEQEIPYETIMDDGTCFIIDEKYIDGGCPGKTAIMARKTPDVMRPEEEDGVNEFINMILAAVRVEQKMENHIEELFGASCFFDIKGHEIHLIPEMEMNIALCADTPVDDKKLKEKADRLLKLIRGLEADMKTDIRRKNSQPTPRLIEALGLWKTKGDYYHRALYLALYEPMLKKLESNDSKTGGSRERWFKDGHANYRDHIAHPDIRGRVNMERFNDLQTDILEELRRIYLESDGLC